MLKNTEEGYKIMANNRGFKKRELAITSVKEYVWKLPENLQVFRLELVQFFNTVLDIARKEEDPIHIIYNAMDLSIL